jgi:glycosyltransferase involved in cell wall biosynthesis
VARITGAILALNEERNIEYCLRSMYTWCDEIIVVDMFSDDQTPQIARRYTDLVLQHQRIADFGAARQLFVDHATSDWILSLDADEVVTPELAKWIRNFVDSDPPYDVAMIPRANVFLGRWLRSTPWWPGKPRLFRKDGIKVTTDLHHGLVPVAGARIATLPKKPEISLWHFAQLSLEDVISKTNRYTTIEANGALAMGRGQPRPMEIFWRSFRELGIYVAKRGYRDGLDGLAYALDRAYYQFVKQAKRWDIPRAAKRRAHYDRWRERILTGFPESGKPGPRADKAPADK